MGIHHKLYDSESGYVYCRQNNTVGFLHNLINHNFNFMVDVAFGSGTF
jgi:hypothetical protein